MTVKCLRNWTGALTLLAATLALPGTIWAQHHRDTDDFPTKTPIKHIVVIFQENISFDHYFATYPHATNPAGEPAFHAKDDTPRVNNLLTSGLLMNNPNTTQPFRLDRTQAVTCDQDHGYSSEQKAFDHGLMDLFPEKTGEFNGTSAVLPFCNNLNGKPQNMVMGYFDGNTVTALWNYAQHFAMSDNSYSTEFGPSTVGALNLVAGNTNSATVTSSARGQASGSPTGNVSSSGNTVIGDPRPAFDDCAPTGKVYVKVVNTGTGAGHDNIGDLLSTQGITWGWFAGGFAPSSIDGTGRAVCNTMSTGLSGTTADYISHHQPFLYFTTTAGTAANVHHLSPTGAIGTTDQADHQYDLSLFQTALNKHQLPAVSFLKAKGYQDGHPGYSNPLDEQTFLVDTINMLQKSEEWNETAVVILYDDSDGWYDHQMSPIVHQSASAGDDFLTDANMCSSTLTPPPPNGRCGFGPRQPFLVVSPWAKENYVDHRITDQSSVIQFIEDNWSLPRLGGSSNDATAGGMTPMFDFDDKHEEARKVFLNDTTGEVMWETGSHEHEGEHHDDRR
jgi:phospholipase C